MKLKELARFFTPICVADAAKAQNPRPQNPPPRIRREDALIRAQNQGAFAIAVWIWGLIRSSVKQAESTRDQAELDLTLAGRELQGALEAFYAEAQGAQSQLDSLRASLDLATQSLRLTLLPYQAGEGAAPEVVDAQTTLNSGRNVLDDGLARRRIAIANLQKLTGNL
jgi:outer membrane protein TolC